MGQIDFSPTSPDPTTGGYNLHYPYRQSNSAIQITTEGSPVNGIYIHDNWLDGGAYTVNIGLPKGGQTYGTGQRIIGNKFGQNQRPDSPAYISAPSDGGANGTWTITGNVLESTGAAVPVLRN
jgi:hypothetical protein